MKTGHADDALKALLLLRSEMAQRDARLGAALSQQIEALQQQAGHFRHDVNAIIRGAGVQIATEAKAAVSPVAREYDRAVSATSACLHRASRTVWAWFGVAGALLVLVLVVGWGLLGYYRRELANAKEELHRHENAVPVVRAFHASDATLCGEGLCVNVDPKGPRTGNQRQYRPARARPAH